MTEVPGRPLLDPEDVGGWTDRLADCLIGIHQASMPVDLPTYRRWDDPKRPLPTWAEDIDLWRRAGARAAGPLPKHPPSFLHRDYHPNNVHWQNGEICAIVDWLSACIGPVAGDLAHCRWNIAVLQSPEAAERFTDRYRAGTGYSEDTIAFDLSTILSGPVGPFPTHAWNGLGRTDLTSETVATRIETWLRHLLE